MNNEPKIINLPRTNFPMQAGLPKLESSILLKNPWSSTSSESSSCVVHDGPPYANGNIHVGHAYNKILKDVLVRYLTLLQGQSPHFVCGWDCHGLPIELAVKKESKQTIDPNNLDVFRLYASKQIENQKNQFGKLGIVVNDHYTTMSSSFENEELKAFQTLVKKGLIKKGHKPVQWCWSCETSLAESELEYESVTDTSAYVLYPCEENYIMVWTTTPWTLKANKAIALNKSFTYALVQLNDSKRVFVSEAFALKEQLTVLSKLSGQDLLNWEKQYLNNFDVENKEERPLFHADYVSETVGTGFVHIAPSCGKEDYIAYLNEFGTSSVESYTNDKGMIGNTFYKKANKEFLELLKALGFVYKEEDSTHSYPHCWRCHKPTIQRATPQVFLDYSSKRNLILDQAGKIRFFPDRAKNRFMSFVLNRTEWCLSRQRTWGVPIPEYHCNDCLKGSFDLDVTSVEQWRNIDYKPTCVDCDGTNTTKGTDILDVWFDSGLTYKTLPKNYSDWVVEGSDQHRGWFQSSHILSCLLEEQTCLVNVVSHGFVLDNQGRKMSKSLGNVIDPIDVANQKGIEILRLWAVSQEVGQDVFIGETSLNSQGNIYRKIRNTLRYLLGNLHDFNETQHKNIEINEEEKQKIDNVKTLFHESFQNIEYYKFMQGLMKWLDSFSSGYIDSSKKVLYESEADSSERRSIQKTYEYVLTSLAEMLEVVLPFTIHQLNEYRKNEKCL